MKRYEIIDEICRHIGHRRKVPHQLGFSKPELLKLLEWIKGKVKKSHGKERGK